MDETEQERQGIRLEGAARAATRFTRDFVATVIALVTTAFGVVVALAWNSALTEWLSRFSKGLEITGLFVYALLVTVLAVLAILFLSRLAARIGAEPIQFAYPVKKPGPQQNPTGDKH